MFPELFTMIAIVILVYTYIGFISFFYRQVVVLHIYTCLNKFWKLVKNYIHK